MKCLCQTRSHSTKNMREKCSLVSLGFSRLSSFSRSRTQPHCLPISSTGPTQAAVRSPGTFKRTIRRGRANTVRAGSGRRRERPFVPRGRGLEPGPAQPGSSLAAWGARAGPLGAAPLAIGQRRFRCAIGPRVPRAAPRPIRRRRPRAGRGYKGGSLGPAPR